MLKEQHWRIIKYSVRLRVYYIITHHLDCHRRRSHILSTRVSYWQAWRLPGQRFGTLKVLTGLQILSEADRVEKTWQSKYFNRWTKSWVRQRCTIANSEIHFYLPPKCSQIWQSPPGAGGVGWKERRTIQLWSTSATLSFSFISTAERCS